HGPHAARRGARPRDRRGDRLVLPGRHSPLRHSPLRGGRRPTVKAMADNADHDRPTLPDAAVTEITELFEDAVAQHKTSGVTWAIVGGHTSERPVLAHGAAGHHELDRGEPTPGSTPMARDSISRIASMTKSFTAAAVLALREEGALRLDDPVASHVPESANAFAGGDDAPAVTIRDLLTMSSGLVTDNPWGDRQESMTREQFAATLRGGLGQVHEVGTGCEYSNTGCALLGRVIDEGAVEGHTAGIAPRVRRPPHRADPAPLPRPPRTRRPRPRAFRPGLGADRHRAPPGRPDRRHPVRSGPLRLPRRVRGDGRAVLDRRRRRGLDAFPGSGRR